LVIFVKNSFLSASASPSPSPFDCREQRENEKSKEERRNRLPMARISKMDNLVEFFLILFLQQDFFPLLSILLVYVFHEGRDPFKVWGHGSRTRKKIFVLFFVPFFISCN